MAQHQAAYQQGIQAQVAIGGQLSCRFSTPAYCLILGSPNCSASS
jgi:hypothetical protein